MSPALVQARIVSAVRNYKYALWSEWNAKNYLHTYFSKLGPDTYHNLNFLVKELSKFKNQQKKRILDFGAGPTVFSALAAAPYASEIHIADYLDSNLEEVKKWFSCNIDAFDWTACIREILKLEGAEVNSEAVLCRMHELRKTPTKILLCDASLPYPLKNNLKYPIVISNFCADSATASKEICKVYMQNICSLVEPGGTLLLSALRKCSFYKIGPKFFPCANIDESDLFKILLDAGFEPKNIHIEVCDVSECAPEGFSSIMFARALK